VRLRPGITFHDGTPLTADAVVATFEGQLADPLVGLTVAPLFAADTLIEAVDDLTVVYYLAGPSSVFPLRLTGQLGLVASPTWLDAVAENPDLSQEPVGTGPFRFDKRTQDSITRFVRNENYWAGEVYLDAVEFYPIADSLRRADQLGVGDLDILHSPGPLADLPDDDVISSVYDRNGEEGYLVMNTSIPPFDDIRVRQALTYAFPQREVNTLTSGDIDVEGQMANQMFSEDSKFFDPDLVQLTDRPDLVGDLISSYCDETPDQCVDGKVRITYSDTGPTVLGERIFAVIDSAWSEWFVTTPRYQPQDEFIIATVTGDYQVTQFRLFGGIDPELDRVFLLCQSIGGIAVNAARYCDPELDELLATQAASDDEAERIEIWRQISQRINQAFTTIWNSHSEWRIAYDSVRVQNLCGAVSPEGVRLACQVVGRTPLAQVWLAG
jgi:peptide/nickel transport system substrate-binding protein